MNKIIDNRPSTTISNELLFGGGWTAAIWTDKLAANVFIEGVYFTDSNSAGINPNIINMSTNETLIVSDNYYKSKYIYSETTLSQGVVSSDVIDLSVVPTLWYGTKLQFRISSLGIAGWQTSVCPNSSNPKLPHQSTSGLYVYAMSYIGCSYKDGSMISLSQNDDNNLTYTGWLRINNNGTIFTKTKTIYYIR